MKKILIILMILLPIISYGQDCACGIHGNVKDEAGKLLPSVYIFIDEKGAAITDDKGHFEIHDLCPGKHQITLKLMGFENMSQSIQLSSHHLIDFALHENHLHVNEVEIHADFESYFMKTQSKIDLKADALSKSAGKSFGESLELLTGVQTLKTGATITKPIIHGMYGSRISIINNDVKLESQQWGQDHAPELDPFSFDQITVIKGASSIQFGSESLSGVVIASPPPLPVSTQWAGKINLVGMSNGKMATFSGTLQKASKKLKELSWRLQGSLKKAGDLHSPDYILSNTGLKEANFSLETGWRAKKSHTELSYSHFRTELGILKAAHTGNLNDLKDAIERQEPYLAKDFSYNILNPKQKVVHHLFRLKNTLHLSKKNTLQSLYSFQKNTRQEYDVRRGNRSDRPATDLLLKTHTLDLKVHRSNEAWQSGIGINATYQTNRNIFGTGVRPIIPYYNSLSSGVYIFQQYILDNMDLEAGLRYDYKNLDIKTFDRKDKLLKPSYNFHNIAYSLGANFYINPFLSMNINISSAFRPPNISELFSEGLHHGSGVIEEGLTNKNGSFDLLQKFDTEVAHKWIKTITLKKDRFTLSATPYIQYIQNYIYLRPYNTRITIRGFFPVFRYQQTNARLVGCDLMGQISLSKKIDLQAQASMIDGHNTKDNEVLIGMSPFRTKQSLKYHLPKWKKLEDIYFTLKASYTAKQRKAPYTVDLTQISTSDYETMKKLQEGPIYDFMAAPKAYTLFDMQMGAKIVLNKKTSLASSLSVDNLFNLKHRNYLNRFRYYADEMGRNITLRFLYIF